MKRFLHVLIISCLAARASAEFTIPTTTRTNRLSDVIRKQGLTMNEATSHKLVYRFLSSGTTPADLTGGAVTFSYSKSGWGGITVNGTLDNATNGDVSVTFTPTNLSTNSIDGVFNWRLEVTAGAQVMGYAYGDLTLNPDPSATATNGAPSSAVRGDMLYTDASLSWARLGIGSSGKLLRSNGSQPSWSFDAGLMTNLNATAITGIVADANIASTIARDTEVTSATSTLYTATKTLLASSTNELYSDTKILVTAATNTLYSDVGELVTASTGTLYTATKTLVTSSTNELYSDVGILVTAATNNLYVDVQSLVTAATNTLFGDIGLIITSATNELYSDVGILVTSATNTLYGDVGTLVTGATNNLYSDTKDLVTSSTGTLYTAVKSLVTSSTNELYSDTKELVTSATNEVYADSKTFTTSTVAGYLPLTGGTLSGNLDMGSYDIYRANLITGSAGAAEPYITLAGSNIEFRVDSSLGAKTIKFYNSFDIMTISDSQVSFGGYPIADVDDITVTNRVTTKYLTVNETINMTAGKITNMANGAIATDAATYGQVTNLIRNATNELYSDVGALVTSSTNGLYADAKEFTIAATAEVFSASHPFTGTANTFNGVSYQVYVDSTNSAWFQWWAVSNRYAVVQIIGGTTNVTFVSP